MRIDDWLMVGLIAVIVVGMFALVKSGDIHSRKKLKSYTAAPTPDWYDYFKDNAPVYLKPQPVGQHMPLDPLLHADPCSHVDNGFDDLLPPDRTGGVAPGYQWYPADNDGPCKYAHIRGECPHTEIWDRLDKLVTLEEHDFIPIRPACPICAGPPHPCPNSQCPSRRAYREPRPEMG